MTNQSDYYPCFTKKEILTHKLESPKEMWEGEPPNDSDAEKEKKFLEKRAKNNEGEGEGEDGRMFEQISGDFDTFRNSPRKTKQDILEDFARKYADDIRREEKKNAPKDENKSRGVRRGNFLYNDAMNKIKARKKAIKQKQIDDANINRDIYSFNPTFYTKKAQKNYGTKNSTEQSNRGRKSSFDNEATYKQNCQFLKNKNEKLRSQRKEWSMERERRQVRPKDYYKVQEKLDNIFTEENSVLYKPENFGYFERQNNIRTSTKDQFNKNFCPRFDITVFNHYKQRCPKKVSNMDLDEVKEALHDKLYADDEENMSDEY